MVKILVFDTETTGLPRYEIINGHRTRIMPYIVQISWILYDANKNTVLSCHDHIVRLPDDVKIPEESIKFHNITQEIMEKHGESISDVLINFVEHVKLSDYVVAHNISFDKSMVETEFSRNGMINHFDVMKSELIFYCTMKNSTALCNIVVPDMRTGGTRVKYPSLEELHTFLFKNSKLSNLHNSYNDVLVCLRCFYMMMYDRDIIRINRNLSMQYKDTFNIVEKSY